MKDHLGMDRPHWGYHCLPKIHQTDRPKPIEEKPAWMDNPKVGISIEWLSRLFMT